MGVHLRELLAPCLSAYYIRDNLVVGSYWGKHGKHTEPKVIATADVVLTNSTRYSEYALQWNKHSYMVGQGCDTSLFDDMQNDIVIPSDMLNIPSPIIGYVGYLTGKRLSVDIIEYIANERPSWSLVLVGPEDEDFKNLSLHQRKNIYFLGSRDSSELPNYIKGFDVAMNPQLINARTLGNYPRKIDEYLSMGKPVLATDTPAMHYFKDYVYLAETKEAYVLLAEKALAEDSAELQAERRVYANSHSWENNVETTCAIIEQVAHEKGISL